MAIKQPETKQFIDKKKARNKGLTYRSLGTTLQALSVQLDEGESIYSEAGKMSWMTDNIKMTTHGQGCSPMVSRIFVRESIFVNKFTCTNGTGIVTFTTDQAGKIIPIDLTDKSNGVIFQKGAYLCSEAGIIRTVALVKRIGAGLFGGKGFIMQKIKGNGKAHLIADGEVAMYKLEEGQELFVDHGNLVAFEDSVDFDIRTIAGPFNWLFSGEGIFFGALRGPGKVWLQTRKSALGSYSQYKNNSNFALSRVISILISLLVFICIFGFFVLSAFSKR